ncbi:unnamed protein product, partial [Nesidiocoris tenuis]
DATNSVSSARLPQCVSHSDGSCTFLGSLISRSEKREEEKPSNPEQDRANRTTEEAALEKEQ